MKAQIEELKRERMAFGRKKNINRADLEKKMAELEQHSRRECVAIANRAPEDTHREELENSIV